MGAGEGVAQGGNTPKGWAVVLCLPVGVTVEQIVAHRLQLATESRLIPGGI